MPCEIVNVAHGISAPVLTRKPLSLLAFTRSLLACYKHARITARLDCMMTRSFANTTGPCLRIGLTGILLWSAGIILSGAAPAGPTSNQSFRMATPGYLYQFPRDHGSHDEFRTEWWYYTGHLKATNGRRFGFQLTFFRRGIDPHSIHTFPSQWTIRHLYLAHVSLSDLDGGRFHFGEKISREGLGKAGSESGHLHVWIDQWSAQAQEDQPTAHRLQAVHDNFSIDLMVSPLKPPTVHGHDGLSRKGDETGQASHYYSLTRLATQGRISLNNETFQVEGMSWMDHEFTSADLGQEVVGWDWFSLQLSDERDLMLYQLRRGDGSPDGASSGTIIEADGKATFLSPAEFTIKPLSSWISPTSNARYPSRWRLTCPSLHLDVEVTPLLADQELVTRRSTQVTYWEGAVQVRGTAGSPTLTGQGYVELTGYAERFSKQL